MQFALQLVIDFSGLPQDVIFSLSRKRNIAHARHIFRSIAYRSGQYILYDIVDFEKSMNSNSDHSKIIHSIKVIDNQLDINKPFKIEYQKMLKKVKALSLGASPTLSQSMHHLHYYAYLKTQPQ